MLVYTALRSVAFEKREEILYSPPLQPQGQLDQFIRRWALLKHVPVVSSCGRTVAFGIFNEVVRYSAHLHNVSQWGNGSTPNGGDMMHSHQSIPFRVP